MPVKYTDEIIAKAVAANQTWVDVMKHLGIKPSGGSHSHLRNRAAAIGLNTDHFVGRAHAKGKRSNRRRAPESILIVQPTGTTKTKTILLRRALVEIGVKEKCASCGLGTTWNDRQLTLQVDHINGNPGDHRQCNLRFLCPNCHTQTPTFGNRKRC